MMLLCRDYNLNVQLDEKYVTSILIEPAELFREFVTKIWTQLGGEEEYIILSEQDKEISFDKAADIITDLFQIDINNRKVINKLYQRLMEDIHESHLEQLLLLQSSMEKLIINVCEQSEYPLNYEANPDFSELLKIYNVHVDNLDSDIETRLISYVKLSHRLLNKKLFIFINLRSYFSDEKLDQLFQTLCYENVNILLIERYNSPVLASEKRIIVDRDACIISSE